MRGKLRVDDKNRKLVMEKTFDVARRIVGSPEYYLLQMAVMQLEKLLKIQFLIYMYMNAQFL